MHTFLLAAMLFGQGSDTVTSIRVSAWTHEVNPLVPNSTAGLVALKASLTTTVAIAAWKSRKQHPKVAAVVFIAGAVSGTWAAVHNARVRR